MGVAQVRRNHSTQYSSYPDYEWLRLRTESPGKYESYVDLAPGEWTRIKFEVNGILMRGETHGWRMALPREEFTAVQAEGFDPNQHLTWTWFRYG